MAEDTVSIRPADPFAPESLRLIEQLWSELGALYPEVTGPRFPPKDIEGPRCFCAGLVGWPGIEPYGRYANDPLSLCFEKSLEAKAILCSDYSQPI
jgi:hypothetical protein